MFRRKLLPGERADYGKTRENITKEAKNFLWVKRIQKLGQKFSLYEVVFLNT